MVELNDLKVISKDSYFDGHERHVVEYDGKHYIVGSHKSGADPDTDPEGYGDWLAKLQGDYAMLFLFGLMPPNESFVMEAKFDSLENAYVPKNECTPACSTGVCNKRVASNLIKGDQELAYNMLLDHLNA